MSGPTTHASEVDDNSVRINAWLLGEGAAVGALGPGAQEWGIRRNAMPLDGSLAADDPAEQADWRSEAVGWGLIAAANPDFSPQDLAAGRDLPESIRALVAGRPGSRILRYHAEALGTSYLRIYDGDGRCRDIETHGAGKRGLGPDRLPRYMLIYGPPSDVPWQLQYTLNAIAYVGRLALEGDALDRYVDALLHDWAGSEVEVAQPIVWAVDLGRDDITWLMRHSIAEPVWKRFGCDPDLRGGALRLADREATATALGEALASRRPGVIVSTSHGVTVPADDGAAPSSSLGLLVDQNGQEVDPSVLLDGWSPNGAIWYAHACCSAGSDGSQRYDGLAEPGSSLDRALEAIKRAGPQVASLPTALLSASPPLRAFIGHVEPTFDWTLRNPETRELLTSSIEELLYTGMFRRRPDPVGLALHRYYEPLSALWGEWRRAASDASSSIGAEGRELARRRARYHQLTALDRQAMVILGDPTVCAPALSGPRAMK